MTNWNELPSDARDDLRGIPIALSRGWTLYFDYRDRTFKRLTPENPPMNPVGFDLVGTDVNDKRVEKHLWKCYHIDNRNKERGEVHPLYMYWRCADVIDNYFCNHRSYVTIEEALEAESLGVMVEAK